VNFLQIFYRQLKSAGNFFAGWHYKWLSFVLIAFGITALSCSFDKPSAPSWDVDVTIPLISKVYTMEEIADEQESIYADSTTGLLSFEESSELDEYHVGDQLDMDDIDDRFSLELGTFDIDSPGSEFTSVQLREIYTEADALHGQDAVVPTFDFETEKKELEPFDDFGYVVIEEGHIDVSINNDLAIPLGSPITIHIWDTAADTVIMSETRNMQVAPGDGKTLPNLLSIVMEGYSPGSDGSPVFVDANSVFEMGGEISNLQVLEAFAQIPEQIVSSEDNMAITDSMVVTDALVESGTIAISLGGNLPLDAWVTYYLPDFITAQGESVVDSFFVRKHTSMVNNINLANLFLRPEPADFSEQQIRFNWTVRTIDTGSEMALVRSNDEMGADFSLTNMRFESITGRIGEQEIDIDQNDIEFDIPADLDSIFFETAQLELEINNGINFPARISMNIEGRNEAGSISTLSIDEEILPAEQQGMVRKTVIVLHQNNSNIKDFISILPNLIKVQGKVRLGDANWVGTITKDDFVDGEVKISAPFSLRLPEQEIEGKAVEMEIDEDVKKDIIDNLANGSFNGQLENHLPLGASIEILFGADSSSTFTSPLLAIGPLRADEAQVDNNGYVAASQTTDIEFSLTEEEMQVFTNESLYQAVRVLIDGTNGQYIKVRNSDYLNIKAYTRIKVKVNQD